MGLAGSVAWIAALGAGAAIAWVDSRPGWDDTGLTAGALLLSGAFLGLIAPRRSWRWGLAIGGWIPAIALRRGGSPWMLLIVAIPTVGALIGAAIRHGVTPPGAPSNS